MSIPSPRLAPTAPAPTLFRQLIRHGRRSILSFPSLAGALLLLLTAAGCKKEGDIEPAPIGTNSSAQVIDTLVNTGRYTLHFRLVKGTGTPLVFEAGAGDGAAVWDTLLLPLHRQLNAPLITYDRVGFGKSPLDTVGLTITNEVQSLTTGLQKLGFNQQYFLVAHSFGGCYSIVFAAQNQARVKGGVFIDITTPTFMTPQRTAAIVAANSSLLPYLQQADPAQYFLYTHYQYTIGQMRQAALGVQMPLTIISSDKTPLTGADSVAWKLGQRDFAQQKSNRNYVLASHTSHYVFLDNPELVTQQIVALYKEVFP